MWNINLSYTRACKRLSKGRKIYRMIVLVYDFDGIEIISPKVKHKMDYYDTKRRFLSIIDQWPYQKPKVRLFCLVFALMFLFTSLVTQVMLIIGKRIFWVLCIVFLYLWYSVLYWIKREREGEIVRVFTAFCVFKIYVIYIFVFS